jgi:hypothetical protein
MNATDARNIAMRQVDANADLDWKEAAMQSVAVICKELGFGAYFTSDEVWAKIESDFPNATTHERKALGPIMAKAARSGLIRKTGQYRESRREACHARPVALWKVQTFSL